MTKYYVVLRFEEEFEVEANNELDAISMAEQQWDPTKDAPEFVEIWSNDD